MSIDLMLAVFAGVAVGALAWELHYQLRRRSGRCFWYDARMRCDAPGPWWAVWAPNEYQAALCAFGLASRHKIVTVEIARLGDNPAQVALRYECPCAVAPTEETP